MFHLIDLAYREEAGARQVLGLQDCWGGGTASYPSREDMLYHRCGHRLNYLDPESAIIHYNRLDAEVARMVPSGIGSHARGATLDGRSINPW